MSKHGDTPLYGLILLDKREGLTSAQALYRVRKLTGQHKSGHAGTLDPAARGLVILCLGRGTKLVEALMDQPKVYRATARLDVTSASFDRGKAFEPVEVAEPPSAEQVQAALGCFEGEIEQVPPAISAVKVDGIPAYKRTHEQEEFELKPRPARIYWLHLHRYDWPELEFEMACGRGTYVRSLIRDLGVALGTGGCLTVLVRTRIGPFTLDDAWTLESLEDAAGPDEYLVELEEARRLLVPEAAVIPERPTGRNDCPGVPPRASGGTP